VPNPDQKHLSSGKLQACSTLHGVCDSFVQVCNHFWLAKVVSPVDIGWLDKCKIWCFTSGFGICYI